MRHATVMVIGALLVVLLGAPASARAWWNDDWEFRKRIDLVPDAEGYPVSGLADVPVLVRLHAGNFPYFLDAQSDGSDLRFIAADDATPLEFHIERFDGIAGVAAVWVRVPRIDPAADAPYFWMYYGNGEAEHAGDSAATFGLNQTAVFHFTEASGLPADATAFGHNATRSSAVPGASGLIDTGIGFDGAQSVEIPVTPALTADGARGTTVSFWLRPTGRGEGRAHVFTQSAGGQELAISLSDLTLTVQLPAAIRNGDETVGPILVAASDPLVPNRWHQVVLTLGDQVRLWLDGEVTATADLRVPAIDGSIVLGATETSNGFRGSIDELRIANVVRPDSRIQFEQAMQSPDSELIAPGEDETRSTTGGVREYFGLFWALLGSVRAEGWIILVCILLMGMLSADVIVNKAALLRRIERADGDFLDEFERFPVTADQAREGDTTDSPLASLHRTASREWKEVQALMAERGSSGAATEGLEVIRAALDAEIVDQVNRLTSRLVLVTIAVSGGPFLGLLGTVVGVMVTFAAIAAAGDVNVNTIAPGVSAALATTVMGLLIAIPSLFGYNYLTTRIAKRTTAMEVFADRLVSRFAMASLRGTRSSEEAADAA